MMDSDGRLHLLEEQNPEAQAGRLERAARYLHTGFMTRDPMPEQCDPRKVLRALEKLVDAWPPIHFLQASELGVSEAEGVRRAAALARLVGYEAGPQSPPKGLPEDFDELGRESARLASLLSEEIEVPGTDWAFALFLYREPRAGERSGHVLQISRSRDRTALAVARWLMDSHEAH